MSAAAPPAAPVRALLPIATPRRARRAVLVLARERPWLLPATLLALAAATAAGLVVPPLIGVIVDVVVDRRPAGDLVAPGVGLLVAALAQGGLGALSGLLVARVGETVLARLRERVVERALALPLHRVEDAGSGDLLSRVSGDVAVVSRAVSSVVPPMALALLTVAFTAFGIAAVDWRLLLAALLATPIQVLGLRHYLRVVVPVYAEQRVAEGERTQQLVAAVSGAPTARALGLGPDRRDRVERSSADAVGVALRALRLSARRFFPALNGAELVGLSAVLVAGFLLVRADALSVGAATAGALYFHRAFDPVGALLFLTDDLQEATTALTRLVGVADLEPEREPVDPPWPGDGAVELRGVTHAYREGHPVLHGIDLRVVDGERVALIGTTGAGKTTLARLVAGVHAPSAGEVRIGGVPLGELGPAGVRRAVVLVSQEVHAFAGTLAEDLRLVAPRAEDADLRAALEQVGALAWVERLPEGLATRIGEGGERLTSTRLQQLALARVLLRDPPVVLLDEATAEAGSAGARELERAAEAALRGRTALVVAHRLTQAAAADRVVVLEHGRLVEEGTHDELIATGGRYATLWAAWDASRADPPPVEPRPAEAGPRTSRGAAGGA